MSDDSRASAARDGSTGSTRPRTPPRPRAPTRRARPPAAAPPSHCLGVFDVRSCTGRPPMPTTGPLGLRRRQQRGHRRRRGPAVTPAQRQGLALLPALILGGGVSVAANIAHSYVPPTAAAPGWTPSPGAVLLAAFWPAAVFVAVEIMARASWAARPALAARPLGRPRPRRAGRRRRVLPAPRRSSRLLRRGLRHRLHRPARRRRPHDRLDRCAARDVARALSRRSTSSSHGPRSPLPAQPTQSTRSSRPPSAIESSGADRPRSTPVGVDRAARRSAGRPRRVAERRDRRAGRAGPRRRRSSTRPRDPRPTSEVDYRPEDVERLKAAVMAGEIPWPIKYEPARKHLRINIKYVKAAAQQITNEGWTPGQEELLDA